MKLVMIGLGLLLASPVAAQPIMIPLQPQRPAEPPPPPPSPVPVAPPQASPSQDTPADTVKTPEPAPAR